MGKSELSVKLVNYLCLNVCVCCYDILFRFVTINQTDHYSYP
jgi:hypothetical protein